MHQVHFVNARAVVLGSDQGCFSPNDLLALELFPNDVQDGGNEGFKHPDGTAFGEK